MYQDLKKDEHLQNKPFLVLGNKIDRPNAVSQSELENAFNQTEVLSFMVTFISINHL
jgi:GTPase SAR1 family protein